MRSIINIGDVMEREILHVDVNNAFLSWTAVEMLKWVIIRYKNNPGGNRRRRTAKKGNCIS